MPESGETSPGGSCILTKLHYFFRILLPVHIRKRLLPIPRKFVSKFGKELSDSVLLKGPSGKTWRVTLKKTDGEFSLQNGWQDFVEYYSLCKGYFLAFRYDGNSKFEVIVFDRSACEKEYPHSQPSEKEREEESVEILGAKRNHNSTKRNENLGLAGWASSLGAKRDRAPTKRKDNVGGWALASEKGSEEDSIEIFGAERNHTPTKKSSTCETKSQCNKPTKYRNGFIKSESARGFVESEDHNSTKRRDNVVAQSRLGHESESTCRKQKVRSDEDKRGLASEKGIKEDSVGILDCEPHCTSPKDVKGNGKQQQPTKRNGTPTLLPRRSIHINVKSKFINLEAENPCFESTCKKRKVGCDEDNGGQASETVSKEDSVEILDCEPHFTSPKDVIGQSKQQPPTKRYGTQTMLLRRSIRHCVQSKFTELEADSQYFESTCKKRKVESDYMSSIKPKRSNSMIFRSSRNERNIQEPTNESDGNIPPLWRSARLNSVKSETIDCDTSETARCTNKYESHHFEHKHRNEEFPARVENRRTKPNENIWSSKSNYFTRHEAKSKEFFHATTSNCTKGKVKIEGSDLTKSTDKCESHRFEQKIKIEELSASPENQRTKPREHISLSKSDYSSIKDQYIGSYHRLFLSKRRPVTIEERDNASQAANAFKSSNPFFKVLMSPSYVCKGFRMHIPTNFTQSYLPRELKNIALRVSSGSRWVVQCSFVGNHSNIGKGWENFVWENNLEEGDVCVFELIKTEETELKVHIYRVVDQIVPLVKWERTRLENKHRS